ncbi:MAG TPA: DNA-processing protein DprA [Actinotalea sp.]
MTRVDRRTVLARLAWSRIAEPGDQVAGALVGSLGPVEALAMLREADGRAEPAFVSQPDGADRLGRAVARWLPRLAGVDAERDLRHITALGGTVLVPEDARWPARLADLGAAAPHGLWLLGSAELDEVFERSVAVVGARACTAYGEHVTSELSADLAGRGWTVVSGGAYGIDAVAHRAALCVEGRTAAFLAGGVDRLYPAGNARLLRAVAERGAAVISEVPPGSAPTKTRFLQRNRLIAAVSAGVVVVEAAWRSGALNTAGHAAELLRPVGAVPGPVTSASSAGCHRLLRDGAAVCVTDAAEVVELVGPVVGGGVEDGRADSAWDGLTIEARRVADALPVVRGVTAESLTVSAGLALAQTRAALGSLELAGVAVGEGGRWRLRRGPARPGDKDGHLGHPNRL